MGMGRGPSQPVVAVEEEAANDKRRSSQPMGAALPVPIYSGAGKTGALSRHAVVFGGVLLWCAVERCPTAGLLPTGAQRRRGGSRSRAMGPEQRPHRAQHLPAERPRNPAAGGGRVVLRLP